MQYLRMMDQLTLKTSPYIKYPTKMLKLDVVKAVTQVREVLVPVED
jgi:hypothetical protein